MHKNIPKHIAVIMDGNGKWARSRLLPKNLGHKKGAEAAGEIIRTSQKLGVEYLTLYAFSSENWHRETQEVFFLMDLFREYLRDHLQEFINAGTKIIFIGERNKLPEDIQHMIADAESSSANGKFTLIIAMSYGAREEIQQAAVKFATAAITAGNLIPDASEFSQYLYTSGIPDPDLLIRTGGEIRISNFLLWQISYSELYFTDKLWPDFTEKDLISAIEEYSRRDRRYGR